MIPHSRIIDGGCNVLLYAVVGYGGTFFYFAGVGAGVKL